MRARTRTAAAALPRGSAEDGVCDVRKLITRAGQVCSVCTETKQAAFFSKKQWAEKAHKRKCLICSDVSRFEDLPETRAAMGLGLTPTELEALCKYTGATELHPSDVDLADVPGVTRGHGNALRAMGFNAQVLSARLCGCRPALRLPSVMRLKYCPACPAHQAARHSEPPLQVDGPGRRPWRWVLREVGARAPCAPRGRSERYHICARKVCAPPRVRRGDARRGNVLD